MVLHAIRYEEEASRRTPTTSDGGNRTLLPVTEFLDRVEAISVTTKLWPDEPSPGSPFSEELALSARVSSYLMARTQLLTAMRRTREATRLFKEGDGYGSHLLMLRPALVLTAKAAWILRSDSSEERVARTSGLLSQDQRMGANAMRKAVSQGAPASLEDVADAIDRKFSELLDAVLVTPIRYPGDETLVRELGHDVDTYYLSDDGSSDTQLLWNTSSSLAHGEMWYSILSGGLQQRRRFAETLTARSFDIACSGIHVTSLRMTMLTHPVQASQEPEGSKSK